MIKKKNKTIVSTPLHSPVFAEIKKQVGELVQKMTDEYQAEIKALFSSNRKTIMDAQDDTLAGLVNLKLDSLLRKYENLLGFYAPIWASKITSESAIINQAKLNKVFSKLVSEVSLSPVAFQSGTMKEVLSAVTQESAALFKTIAPIYHSDVQKAVFNSIANGKGYADLVPFFEARNPGIKNYAITRTQDQSAKAYNGIAMAQMKNAGIEKFEWMHTSGSREPRKLHEELNGKKFSFDNLPFIGVLYGKDIYGIPGQLPNCFPGSTKVSMANGCRNVWRYWYEGDMISFVISGEIIECTPNHPILTLRGWLSANEIKEGDYLVSSLANDQWGIDTEINEGFTTFENLFISNTFSHMESISGTKFNFHGDIPKNDVDSIVVNNNLPFWKESIDSEEIEQFILTFSDSLINDVVSSANPEIIKPCFSGLLSDICSFINSQSIHSKFIGFASISENDSLFIEQASNDSAGTLELLGKIKDAIAGIIERDNIINLIIDINEFENCWKNIIKSFLEGNTKPALTAIIYFTKLTKCDTFIKRFLRVNEKTISIFSGHVYTMESYNGWYSVTSTEIISKNCKCLMKPVLFEIPSK